MDSVVQVMAFRKDLAVKKSESGHFLGGMGKPLGLVWVEGPHFWRALSAGIGPQDILLCMGRPGKGPTSGPGSALSDPLVCV